LRRILCPENDFDPATMTDSDNPVENTWSKSEHLGVLREDMVFDCPLDEELFSLSVPDGFELVRAPPRPAITRSGRLAADHGAVTSSEASKRLFANCVGRPHLCR